MAFYCCKFGHT